MTTKEKEKPQSVEMKLFQILLLQHNGPLTSFRYFDPETFYVS